ncbi:MAG: DUF2384 domain-containing protein [Gammaproteobacteria bacterium]
MKKQKSSKRRSSGKKRAAGRKQSKSSVGSVRSSARREWIGGRFPAPMYVGDDEPYRPLLELWVANDLIVHFSLHDPNEPIPAVSEDLRHALSDLPSGRRPGRLRLNDADWAAEVRRALPRLDVIAGPTPELEEPLDYLISSMEADAGPATYLAGGVSADAVATLFDVAAALYHLAPWQFLDDDQLIEVDIPELDVSGACLSIIGALGESLGILLFDSIAGFERMLDASEELEATGQISNLDWVMTSLNYERGADLPESMRREVQRHGWPVAAATAYPVVEHRGGSDLARPATARELRIMTACAEALVSILGEDPDAFLDRERVSWSQVDRSGLTVHLTSPASGGMAGYEEVAGRHLLDHELLFQMVEYARDRWGRRLVDRLRRLFRDEFEEQLILPIGAYHVHVEGGRTLAEHFLEDHAADLDAEERRWLDAQCAAWLSLWEVVAVYPDEGVELRDLLTAEARRVTDREAADSLTERSVVLARVVDSDGESLLCGSHSAALAPLAALEVAERMRTYLKRKSAVPPARLREPNTVRYLIRSWQDQIDEIERTRGVAPEIRNTDGDVLLGTVDRYAFDAAERQRVEAALLDIDGLEPVEPGHYVALREHRGSNTVIGSVRLERKTLRVETNSVERADTLRKRIERACAGLLTHRGRSHEDPLAALERETPAAPPPAADDIPPEQLDLIIQTHKRQHYENWLDDPIPALGNKTPRQAVRSASGRSRVEALLSEIEYLEASLPPGQRFDVSVLRHALKL